MNEKIDTYIKNLPSSQREISQKLRKLILNTYPDIKEEMKYGVPYYNNDFYIVGLKDHVNLGVSIRNLSPEEISLFEGTGKTTRHIKLRSVAEIDENKILSLLAIVKKK
ncbi:MAG: DUF1801 domain-containing protein [Promethearchaeota archaeon]|nr:MAG: DUF1801 domain-containing protein [Candidatus Lokiarchaeota archaeon]